MKEDSTDNKDSTENRDSTNEDDNLSNRTDTQIFSTFPSTFKSDFEIKQNKYIKTDPYDTNFFSRLFYIPGLKIILYIREGLPMPSDLGTLLAKNKSKNYSKKLINEWNHTRNKNLLKIILRANKCPLIVILLFSFIQESLTMISVQLGRNLIADFMDQGNVEKQTGYFFLVIHFIYIFLCRKLNDYQISTGYKMGYQLECLIYNKLMYSKNFKKFISRNNQIITTADIVNYIQIDCYKLINSILTVPNFIILPYALIVYFYMIFSYFQDAFKYGLVIFVVFMLTNFIFLAKFRHHQSQEQINKDETMKITLKTLNDIENIKFNAEEVDYIKKIYEKKNKEMACYSNKCLVNNVNSAILWFVPIAMTIMTIFVFQNLHKENMNVANIFSLLNILIQINEPIRDIPGTLRSIYETWVSVKRIENYLKSSDQNELMTYYEKNNIDLINKKIMVKIVNGFFTWGKQKQQKEINKTKDKDKKEKKKDNNKDKERINNDSVIDTKSDKKIKEEKKTDDTKEEPLIPNDVQNLLNNSDDNNPKSSFISNSSDSGNNPKEKVNLLDFFEMDYPLEDPETTSIEIVLKKINLTIKKGELVLIYGKSGSGKSSLLEAILNQMKVFFTYENSNKIITSINGTISYYSQTPFIYNTTIRQNITLDLQDKSKTNFNRYLKVIDICSLREDISEFNGGDLTEIGENGKNLSSGQRRRIAIARCLYAKKDIYLLDQPTYNLYSNFGNKILMEGILSFLKRKTRIVVTDKEEFAQYANRIIVLKEGEIIFNGNYYALTHDEKVKKEGYNFQGNTDMIEEKDLKLISLNSSGSLNSSDTFMSTTLEDNYNSNILVCPDLTRKNTLYKLKELTYKTTTDEKITKYKYNKIIFKAPIPFLEGYKLIILVLIIILEWQLTINGSDLWMVFWNREQSQGQEKNWRYLVVYASFGFYGAFLVYFRNRSTTKATNNFIKNLNFHMAYNLVKAPNTFYSETPKSQIINRLSFDLNNLEDNFFRCWVDIISIGTSLIIRIAIYIYFFKASTFILIPLTVLLILLSLFYVKSARQLNRMECSLRTILIEFLNETTLGKSTIKAFDVVGDFLDEFYKQIDRLYKCRIWINLAYQWFGLILGLFSFTLDLFFILNSIYGDLKKNYGLKPEVYGLLLNYLFTFRNELKKFQFSFSEIQGVFVAFERTNEYNQIFSENYVGLNNDDNDNDDKDINNDNDIDNDSQVFKLGNITFQDYSLKYKLNEKLILKNINFTISSGEKIGIIGRSGGGKSSFIYALTRMVEPFTGKIIIDGIDIATLPLQVIRKNICVLSHHNGISEGTLRSNLDPLNKHTEEEMKYALKKLNYWFNKDENQNYGLNDHIEESGSNLTLAEKNLLAITKLILNNNCSIIILDDLTTCLDNKMQKIVYEAIYETFPDSTVIVIANEIKDFMNKVLCVTMTFARSSPIQSIL